MTLPRRAALTVLLLALNAGLQAQNGSPFNALLTKDFAPSAVSRAGALSTYDGDPLAIWYNPSITPFLKKENKVNVQIVHALLPQSVWLDGVAYYQKQPGGSFFLSLSYFGSTINAYNLAREQYGEMANTTFLLQANSAFLPPKQNLISFGANYKLVFGRSYVYDRIMVGLDGSATIDLPKQRFRMYAGFRNLGIDLSTFIRFDAATNSYSLTNQDLRYQTPWPFSAGVGGRYQFENIAELFLDFDYFLPTPDLLRTGGTILDGTMVPKFALSLIAVENLKLNIGRVFRSTGGTSYFTFGMEYLLRIPNTPGIVFQYAFEPIPGFTDNHYFGLNFRLL